MKHEPNTKDTCFALRANDIYYVSSGECCALKWPDYKQMRLKGKCNTMNCPFYKPKRYMNRCGSVIKGRKGTIVMRVDD